MDFDLYFCKDGIIRVKSFGNKTFLPLQFIKETNTHSYNELQFFSYWWNCNTYFEEGLTVAQFLEGLKPWASFWSDYTGVNITEYIIESKKPILAKKQKNQLNIDWINLSFQTEVNLNVEYKRIQQEKNEDLNSWFNQPKEIRLTDDWNISERYLLTGYSKGYVEHYSVEQLPMNLIANIPLYLDNKQLLFVNDNEIKKFFSEQELALNPQGYSVKHAGDSKSGRGVFKYLQGEKTHSLKSVIDGFFSLFSTNINIRENQFQDIKKAIEEAKQNEIKEKNTSNSNIYFSPNAFSSIINDLSNQDNYWEKLNQLAKTSDIIPRIGQITTGTTPENRVFAYIVDDKKNLTDYKLDN